MEIMAANNIDQSLLLLHGHQLQSSSSVQSMTPVLSSHPSCHLGCFPPLLADCRSNSPLGRLSSCTSAPLPLSLVISIYSEYNGSYLIPKLTIDHCQRSPPISTSSEESGVVLKSLKQCAISLSRPLQLEIFLTLKFLFCVRGILPACGTLRIWRPLNFWVGWVFSGVTGQISNKGGQLKALYPYFLQIIWSQIFQFLLTPVCYVMDCPKPKNALIWAGRQEAKARHVAENL